ncbi:MAG: sulfite exporter TauE/SafE family protein [Clostridia bacterium]|nr:sulfite exporter TauE/SafE family protein [Clostridia bacterium]
MDFAVIISSLLSGLLGSMGFGGGSVLIIYLTSFLSLPQKQAQGINLLFFIPIAVLSIIMYSKEKLVTLRQILPVMLPAVLGAAIGFSLLKIIPGEVAGKLFGALLILMGIRQLLVRSK